MTVQLLGLSGAKAMFTAVPQFDKIKIMNTEFSVEQIRAFVARGYNSVAARMTKSLLQHFDALASNPKEPEAVHGNEAEKEVLNDFISAIQTEFADMNWDYLPFIAERVLENRKNV